jgi:rare lipoprotein A (peptidoglycan hydrolase)
MLEGMEMFRTAIFAVLALSVMLPISGQAAQFKYDETLTASWYGGQYHGKRTAAGE